ncbi:MAG: hypothetical protein NVS9B15_00270 [Acidobacteriaceae bacterium]
MTHSDLIFDWNSALGAAFKPPARTVQLTDESLRDGLQSPSVRDPSIDQKLEILHLMETLGIDYADLGLPGAGPRAVADVERLAREIVDAKLKIRPNCAARTHESDIRAVAEISQRVGLPIEVATFLGSSPIRRYAENWTPEFLFTTTENAVKYARSLGLEVMYVTEDTTRCDPETVKRLYKCAIENGAKAIVVCDTVGHATPAGVKALIRFVIDEVIKPSGEVIRLDWHGHCDRGLAIANSLAALEAGAECVHGCGIGIGERVGNTQIDLLLVNLKLMGVEPWAKQDVSKLKDYCYAISNATGVPIPANYPVVGADAFRTATGVHAAAVIKAFKKNDTVLANTVYSGVPAHEFGLEQVIDVGPVSGRSNVLYWLQKRGYSADEACVERILAKAKGTDHTLSTSEITACLKEAATV